MKFNDFINKILNEDMIKGGLADGLSPEMFDADQLSKGMEVEMEHTDDPVVAMEIAMDHLAENPKYYDYLDKMEKQMKAGSDKPKTESMTSGGAGGVFTAYAGTVDAGQYGGHVGNVDFYAPGDARIPQGPGKAATSGKSSKKEKKRNKNNKGLMPVGRRMFPNM